MAHPLVNITTWALTDKRWGSPERPPRQFRQMGIFTNVVFTEWLLRTWVSAGWQDRLLSSDISRSKVGPSATSCFPALSFWDPIQLNLRRLYRFSSRRLGFNHITANPAAPPDEPVPNSKSQKQGHQRTIKQRLAHIRLHQPVVMHHAGDRRNVNQPVQGLPPPPPQAAYPTCG